MLRKNLIPVCVGILALISMYLMGGAGGCPVTAVAPVPMTGQTVSYLPGDDGALQKGVAWPSPRFIDNADGTVTDQLTGLIWTEAIDCYENVHWANALNYCNTLANGTCGLSDTSKAGDWRLANYKEFMSLMDLSVTPGPALPAGHPFSAVDSSAWTDLFWTSTTVAGDTDSAWGVKLTDGSMSFEDKVNDSDNAWCVKAGQWYITIGPGK